jgi:HK97 family phage major capsid protein
VNEKFQALIKEAKALLDAGKLDEAKVKRAEAESVRDAIAEAKSLAALEADYAPVRPAVPGVSEGSVPNVITAGSVGTKSAVAEPDEDEDKSHLSNTQKAAYVTRFGDEDKTVKAILSDLHGKEFKGLYWAQKAAFNRYVRAGDKAISSDDAKLLKGIILNPQIVKMALDQGVDDIKALKSMMVEASDTLGGYMVPVDFQMRVIEQLAALTVIRGRASQMNTSRDRVEFPEATGGNGRFTSPVRTTWVDETPTIGQLASNYVTFGLRGINIHTAMSEAPLSRNFLEDLAFDIEGYLSQKLAESVSLDEDEQFLIGDGVGKPRGILPGLANIHALTEEHSLDANVLTWKGLIATTYAIPAQYRQEGVWLANRNTYQAIAQMQDATSGNFLWQAYQFDGGEAGRTKTLLGYPILESELMPDVAANAFPILFGNLNAYQIVDRLGMTVERFIGAQEARQNLVYFVMRRRLGGDLLEPWKLVAQKVAA